MSYGYPHTLLLMACSATKIETAKPVPAIELYDGPLWQTLRKYRPEDRGALTVCVLSGKYGFINALSPIAPYESRLTEQRAAYLMSRGIHERNDRFGAIKRGTATGCTPFVEADAGGRLQSWRKLPYERVIIAAAEPYRLVLETFAIAFQREGLVAGDASLQYTSGGIGEQRGQLGQLLRLELVA